MGNQDRPAARGSLDSSIALGGLTARAAPIAAALVSTGRASGLEAVSFVTGAAWVARIEGDWDTRLATATAAVSRLLDNV